MYQNISKKSWFVKIEANFELFASTKKYDYGCRLPILKQIYSSSWKKG